MLAKLTRFLLLLVVFVATTWVIHTHAQPVSPGTALRVDGDVKRVVILDRTALQGLPQQSASLGGKTYIGVSLWDVLAQAGPTPIGVRHNPTLSMYVLAQGGDGYQALFSLGELDPAIGARTVLIAHSVDGAPLETATGPIRLVIPADLKPARAVFRLISLQVKTAP